MQNLGKTVSSLKSKNESLTSELEKLRNNLDKHSSGCETFRKTTKSQLKCLDGLDFTEYQVKNNNECRCFETVKALFRSAKISV